MSARTVDPKSRSVVSLAAAASNSVLRFGDDRGELLACLRPPSALSRNALDSSPSASFICWPLPSAIAALELTTSPIGPSP